MAGVKEKTTKKRTTGGRGSPARGVLKIADLVELAEPVEPTAPDPVGLAAGAVDAADEVAGINTARDDPHRLARIHLEAAHGHDEVPTLLALGGEFRAWDGRCYRDVTDGLGQP